MTRQPDRGPRSSLRYWPHPPGFVFALMLIVGVVFAVVWVQASTTAFALAGLSPVVAGLVLLASLVGSVLNVPVAHLQTGRAHLELRRMRFVGMVYIVPVAVPGRTTIAVNVGGAVIPVGVSLYLVTRGALWVPALIASSAVALLVHVLARPVRGVGIAVPTLVPAVIATAAAVLLHPPGATASLAYIAGTIGTLVGADLTHLGWIRRTEAPVASIGGAGTFDGVFITGVLAVLLAALL